MKKEISKEKLKKINELFDYIDSLINDMKEERFMHYVRSKKVKFTSSTYSVRRNICYIEGKTLKGRHIVQIWFQDNQNVRPNRYKCSCGAFKFNKFKSTESCKHIIALSEKFQSIKEKITC